MNFNQESAQKWVTRGIEKETITAAFIAGWNLVCPNNKISTLDDIVTLKEKSKGDWVVVFEKKFSELTDADKGRLVSSNKSDSLTTSQIRIAFGEMRKIQMNSYKNEKTNFLMLKPKLAYAVKRHDKKGLNEFYKIFGWVYDSVNTKNEEEGEANFENFIQIMEAILAYHKFHGGKE